MPARTNEFQEVVASIQRLYAPSGAKITSPALIQMRPDEDPREIDILVEFEANLSPFRLAVEARGTSTRKIGSQTVEEYIGKYLSRGGIHVDKVMIVGKSFYKPALRRAKEVGFIACTLEELTEYTPAFFAKGREVGSAEKPLRTYAFNLELFGIDGEVLGRPYHSARLYHNSIVVGTPLSWAQYISGRMIGEEVDRLRAEHAGQMVRVSVQIVFDTAQSVSLAAASKRRQLSKMQIDFQKVAVLPDMLAQSFQYQTVDPNNRRRIVRETGRGASARVSVTYEDSGEGPPSAIHVEGVIADEIIEQLEVAFTRALEHAQASAKSEGRTTPY